jgi:hypothetical protein
MTRISQENQIWQNWFAAMGRQQPCPSPRLWTIVLGEDNPHDVALVRMSLKDAGLNIQDLPLKEGTGS